jgi:hypothetical protein
MTHIGVYVCLTTDIAGIFSQKRGEANLSSFRDEEQFPQNLESLAFDLGESKDVTIALVYCAVLD